MWPLIILLIFAALILVLYFLNLLLPVALFTAAGIFAFLFYKFFIRKFDPFEAAIIYRFGKFHRVSPSGWAIVIPVFEKVGYVLDLREQQEQIDVPIISREGLEIKMHGVVFYYISNAVNAALGVQNYKSALTDMITARVRDIAGEFSFTQLLINIEDIAALMIEQIQPSIQNWGLTINNFEMERMEPPRQVLDALRGKKVAAESLEAKKFVAEARRVLTAALGKGTESFDDRTLAYLYVKALENMKSSKMMIPAEFMDVVKSGAAGGNNLAKGMISGSTFNKALNMIGDEVLKESAIGKSEIKRKIEEIGTNAKEENEMVQEEEDNREVEESNKKVVAGDSADGNVDGQIGEK
ncbi:MAG: SPFH domain-containing protein [Candidatus Nanoarchaeia archaeon]|nr:SPFH domain-containing protein [Candidatus Nanoarchaeia archaeon]